MALLESQKAVLVTGGVGFIGQHFVEHILRNTNWHVVILDRIDVSSNVNRLTDMECWESTKHRVKFVWHDLKAPVNDSVKRFLLRDFDAFDFIFHLAASTHVDRSIEDPLSFAMDNVVGTVNILDFARKNLIGDGKFFYFSTDEVFGPAPEGVLYKEWDRYNSSNPYSASKAGGEEMAIAFANTYKVPTIITHTMNVFGERQNPEKFIIKVIRSVRDGEAVPIHANTLKTMAGSRFYVHARNVAATMLFLTEHGECLNGSGKVGKYNIVGEQEIDNLELAKLIAQTIGRELRYELVDFHTSRPGHDLRYALDGTLLRSMGWDFPKNFKDSLIKTIQWTLGRPEWA
jgi:dTDP-glucose 4,6-dehydratase